MRRTRPRNGQLMQVQYIDFSLFSTFSAKLCAGMQGRNFIRSEKVVVKIVEIGGKTTSLQAKDPESQNTASKNPEITEAKHH